MSGEREFEKLYLKKFVRRERFWEGELTKSLSGERDFGKTYLKKFVWRERDFGKTYLKCLSMRVLKSLRRCPTKFFCEREKF